MGVSTPVVVTLTSIDFVDTTALFSGIDHDMFLDFKPPLQSGEWITAHRSLYSNPNPVEAYE
jgi:hypothetical protein